jgi:hypothetical protein
MTICTAHNRNGSACDRESVDDRTVCRIHGGLGGAPAGNANRLRHGLYAKNLHQLRELAAVAEPRRPTRFAVQHAARIAEAAARTIARRLSERTTVQLSIEEWRLVHDDLSAAKVLIGEVFRAK